MNVYSIILLITAAVTASLSFYALKYRLTEGAISFILLNLAASFFSLGYAFELEADTLQWKLFWTHFEYLGIAFIPVLYWIFAIQYSGKGNWLTRKVFFFVILIPLSVILMQWTNSLHHLFYADTGIKDMGSFSILVIEKGPLFWYHIAYANGFILMAVANLAGFILNAPKPYRNQAAMMLLGSIAPWVTNIVYVSGYSPHDIDLSPFGFSLSGVVFAIGLFHYRLLDFVLISPDNIFECMREGAILIDKNYRLVNFNPAAGKIIKNLSVQYIGKSVMDIPVENPMITRLLESPELQVLRFEQPSSEGLTRYYQAEKSFIRNKKSTILGEYILIYDTTRQVISEQIMKQNEQKLARLNSTKDKFFSIIAHDLRGPLGTSNAFLDLLTDDAVEFSPEERKNYLMMLRNTSKTTFELLENLLTWARSQSGQIPFHPREDDLVSVIRKNLDLFSSNARDKNIRMEIHAPEKQPAFFDYNMINAILRNMINNAIKYTDEYGIITLSCLPGEDRVEIMVKDTGIGMTAKTVDSLFSENFPNPSTFGTKGEKGSGIGLEICKEFAEHHGGTIHVESKPGKGSTFSFSVPLQQSPLSGEN